jgi:cytochrome c553
MTWRFIASSSLLLVALTVAGGSRMAGESRGFDEGRLPARLVDTGLYVDADAARVGDRVRRFAPQYPLWSDGAAKTRWVSLPAGTIVDGSDVHAWQFPVGTRFWKEFAFNGRKVETRMLWKAAADEWLAASYVWNEEGTDATLAPEEGVRGVVEIAPGRRHSIPSRADCAACHGQKRAPLGFTALQLSADRDPNAIHGEPLTSGMVTLDVLVAEGLLLPAGAVPGRRPRIATGNPNTRAVLGYLLANCGSCHNGTDDISVPGPSLNPRDLVADADAVVNSLLARSSRWQVPGTTDGTSRLIDLASPEASALLARIRSRRPSSQMPPLGTVMRDDRAIGAIEEWIRRDLAGAPARTVAARVARGVH